VKTVVYKKAQLIVCYAFKYTRSQCIGPWHMAKSSLISVILRPIQLLSHITFFFSELTVCDGEIPTE